MTEIVAVRGGVGYGWDPGENGWKPGVDYNFQYMATMTGLEIISDALTAPPGSPANGDTYLVGASATGAWSGHDGLIASYMAGTWYIFELSVGLRGWFENHSEFRRWTGSVWTTEVTSRKTARVLAQWVSGAIVKDGAFKFMWKAPYAGTVNSLDRVAGNDSFTLAVKINGTNITGLSAVSVTTSSGNTAATAANTFSAGDEISGTISSTSGAPTDVFLNLNLTWAGT